jgi:K+-transporting ATPase ATPase C chain
MSPTVEAKLHRDVEAKVHHGPFLHGLVRPALTSALLFMVVTGLAYPLAVTGIAQLVFPKAANGSLLERGGTVIGSSLIGQMFTKPQYFHPRPSATTGTDPKDASKTVDQPYNAASSGASNLGPTSQKLMDEVAERAKAYRAENDLAPDQPVPVDAVTASGSGLDPDISLANARLQVKRIASARGMTEVQVEDFIDRHVTPRQGGLLGEPRVNVLGINLALDADLAKPSAGR